MGNWLNLKIDGWAAWPIEVTPISFLKCELVLMPATRETEQSIHVNLSGVSEEEAFTVVNRFLSILSWCEGTPIEVDDSVICGRTWKPMPIGRGTNRRVGSCAFRLYPFFREVESDPKVSLALALYREARTVNSIPYSFLGYYKILNIWWDDRTRNKINKLVEGIRGVLPKVDDGYVKQRIFNLSKTESDIPKYLHESCRCAVAHANKKPTVDPDNWSDIKRLAADLEIIRAVAEHLIEEKGVSRSIIG